MFFIYCHFGSFLRNYQNTKLKKCFLSMNTYDVFYIQYFNLYDLTNSILGVKSMSL